MEKRTIEISWPTIFRILLVFLLIVFLYAVRDIAAILFLALVIASAIDPLAQWFEKKGVSRIFTVLAVYLTAFGLIGLLVYLIVPVLLTEIRELSAVMPAYVEKINSFIRTIQPATEQNLTETLKGFLRQLEGSLGLVASNSLEAVIAVFGGITSLVLTVVISFYLSIQNQISSQFFQSQIHKIFQTDFFCCSKVLEILFSHREKNPEEICLKYTQPKQSICLILSL